MNNKNLLNTEQVKHLQSKKWEVLPAGAYLDLYPTDFENNTVWEDICGQLAIPYDSDKVTILYFGIKTSEE